MGSILPFLRPQILDRRQDRAASLPDPRRMPLSIVAPFQGGRKGCDRATAVKVFREIRELSSGAPYLTPKLRFVASCRPVMRCVKEVF